MVTATLGPRLPVSNGTPTKRSTHASPSYPAAKRQRSYADQTGVEAAMKRAFPDDRGGDYAASLASPAQMVKLEQPDLPVSSPTSVPLKSSLKSSVANVPSNVLDSPSEGDKRGMYLDYVQSALDNRARGKEASYAELVSQFRAPSPRSVSSSPPISLLQMLLHSLTNVASRLDRRNHTPLIDSILTLPWATMGGDAFSRTWMRFVCTLCSARSEWVGEVLSRAVKGLRYRSDWRSLAYNPTGTSSSRPTRRIIYSRIHSLLRSLLSLIPTLATQLAPLVLNHFPHKREDVKEHVVYIRNIFEMCEYADELRPGVLECVLGRGVEIDVEIQIELDELEEAEADLEDLTVGSEGDMRELTGERDDVGNEIDPFDMPIDEDSQSEDGDEDDSGSEEGLEGIQSEDDIEPDVVEKSSKERERTTQIRKLVDKLDAIMEAMFRQLEATDTRFLRVCKGLNPEDIVLTPARAISLRNDQFTELMHIFTRTLLPTFKCRHVQFILFWFSSLDRDFSDLFLGLLLSKAIYASPRIDDERGGTVEEVPMIMRVAAASYVASLVSRAKYINKRDARTVMLNLCAFMEAHLDAYGSGLLGSTAYMQRMDDSTVVGPNSLFYAVCQACFYIFCFRWRDLQLGASEGDDEGEGDGSEADDAHPSPMAPKWCEGMDVIKRAIMSNLNPLANCSAPVAEQFAGVAQLTGFLYCWSLIERNSRGTVPAKTASLVRSDSDGTVSTPVDAPTSRQNGSANASTIKRDLDSFFPFDPYRLRSSTKWIEPLYREWSDVAPDGMIDDDDDDGEKESESSSDDSDSAPTRNALKIPRARRSARPDRFTSSSASTNDDQVAQSLEAMSISPFRPR